MRTNGEAARDAARSRDISQLGSEARRRERHDVNTVKNAMQSDNSELRDMNEVLEQECNLRIFDLCQLDADDESGNLELFQKMGRHRKRMIESALRGRNDLMKQTRASGADPKRDLFTYYASICIRAWREDEEEWKALGEEERRALADCIEEGEKAHERLERRENPSLRIANLEKETRDEHWRLSREGAAEVKRMAAGKAQYIIKTINKLKHEPNKREASLMAFDLYRSTAVDHTKHRTYAGVRDWFTVKVIGQKETATYNISKMAEAAGDEMAYMKELERDERVMRKIGGRRKKEERVG